MDGFPIITGMVSFSLYFPSFDFSPFLPRMQLRNSCICHVTSGELAKVLASATLWAWPTDSSAPDLSRKEASRSAIISNLRTSSSVSFFPLSCGPYLTLSATVPVQEITSNITQQEAKSSAYFLFKITHNQYFSHTAFEKTEKDLKFLPIFKKFLIQSKELITGHTCTLVRLRIIEI